MGAGKKENRVSISNTPQGTEVKKPVKITKEKSKPTKNPRSSKEIRSSKAPSILQEENSKLKEKIEVEKRISSSLQNESMETGVNESGSKCIEELTKLSAKQSIDNVPVNELDDDKKMEKAKVLKVYLENKYKVEFPVPAKDTGVLTDSDEKLTEKEILARNGLENLSEEKVLQMLKIKDRLDAVLSQAEEFFSNIGMVWTSEHQMYRVKPKKDLPPFTMIAFGPEYEDVIVCKDDQDTGETKACVLNKEDQKCPKDITAIDLNIYRDGFQAEGEDFETYSSESIKDFFLNHLGSFIIMKPNPDIPGETVLIRVIDDRDRTFEECQGNQDNSNAKTKRLSKLSKSKRNSRENQKRKTSMAYEDADGEIGPSKPKVYGHIRHQTKPKTESVEIFNKHRIINRLDDKDQDDDKSSWYWHNKRKSLSSEYVVPPSTTDETIITPSITNIPLLPPSLKQSDSIRVERLPSRTEPTLKTTPVIEETNRKSQSPVPNVFNEAAAKIVPVSAFVQDKEKPVKSGTLQQQANTQRQSKEINFKEAEEVNQEDKISVSDSLVNGIKNGAVEKKTAGVPLDDVKESRSETKIKNVNIYHGPVTVINLIGDKSDESIQVYPTQDSKLKVTAKTYQKTQQQTNKRETTTLQELYQREALQQQENEEKMKKDEMLMDYVQNLVTDWEEYSEEDHRLRKPEDDHQNEIFFPPLDDGYDMYETEYDYAYNKSPARWPQYFSEVSRRKSAGGPTGKDPLADVTQIKNFTILGRDMPRTENLEEQQTREVKKISVLLDLGPDTGKEKREADKGIELNKKTSEHQVTVSLRANNTGQKYVVNIYPEEQLKKIWSILKLNNINIQNVTPELILGNEQQSKAAEHINIGTPEMKTEEKKISSLDEMLTEMGNTTANENGINDIISDLLKSSEKKSDLQDQDVKNGIKSPQDNNAGSASSAIHNAGSASSEMSIKGKNSDPPSIGSDRS